MLRFVPAIYASMFDVLCNYIGIGEIEIPKTGTFIYPFHYLFDIFIHVTLALSVFATSQSALVLIYGPTKVGKFDAPHESFVSSLYS